MIKFVPVSEHLAVEVFERLDGTFGYRYRQKEDDRGEWLSTNDLGPGSVYDTAEKAEKYGLSNANVSYRRHQDSWNHLLSGYRRTQRGLRRIR